MRGMPKPNVETLLDLIQRSGLVEKDRRDSVIRAASNRTGNGQLPDDVDQVAGRFVTENLVTQWQSDQTAARPASRLLCRAATSWLGPSRFRRNEHGLSRRARASCSGGVAIKVLPKGRVNDTSYLARFHREARAAASLDHPNIVRVYDVDNDGDTHYMVMEFVDGRDLQQMRQAQRHARLLPASGRLYPPGRGRVGVRPFARLLDPSRREAGQLACRSEECRQSARSWTLASDSPTTTVRQPLTRAVRRECARHRRLSRAPEQAVDSHPRCRRTGGHLQPRLHVVLSCSLVTRLFPDGTLPQRLMGASKAVAATDLQRPAGRSRGSGGDLREDDG